jgi:hypothetical protein
MQNISTVHTCRSTNGEDRSVRKMRGPPLSVNAGTRDGLVGVESVLPGEG